MPARVAPSNARFSQPIPADVSSSLLLQDSEKGAHRRSRELLGLAILALGLFITLGLFTFRRDPLDPTVSGPNWVGPVGDCASGWIVQGFGVVAFLLPVELFLIGLSLLRSREIAGVGFRLASDLILGILLSSMPRGRRHGTFQGISPLRRACVRSSAENTAPDQNIVCRRTD